MRNKFIVILISVFILVIFRLFQRESQNKFIWTPSQEQNKPDKYSILSVNVGNSNLQCYTYKWKLCKKDVENRLKENIATVKPDIILVQEVLPPWLCEEHSEKNPTKVCYDDQEPPQIRRLLGDEYSIACEPLKGYECVGVRKTAGEFVGCLPGEICDARPIKPISGCDPGFSISAVTVKLNNGAIFDIVHSHPQSFSASCRAESLQQAFYPDSPEDSIIQQDKIFVMGDFNFDPWRDNDESVDTWKGIYEKGWKGLPFRYHSGIVEKDPPYYTLKFMGVRRTIDFVVSNFADGKFVVLGESPGTSRLDGGAGNDHRALYGILEISP
jgi:hypothetical protein